MNAHVKLAWFLSLLFFRSLATCTEQKKLLKETEHQIAPCKHIKIRGNQFSAENKIASCRSLRVSRPLETWSKKPFKRRDRETERETDRQRQREGGRERDR